VVAVRIGKFVDFIGILSVLGGCQMVGPIAIDAGRDRYNSVLQSTAKVQTLANIIRVYHHETTSFMDVTEVDATQTFSGAVSGAVTNIGARAGTSGGTLAGEVGGISPGVTYSEAPLIRYVPLIGQGLVSQFVTPVSVDALESLYNSNAKTAVLLDLASYYITPDVRYSPTALNMISLLADEFAVVNLVAEKSQLTITQSSTANQSRGQPGAEVNNGSSNGATRPAADDALTIFLQPENPAASNYVKARAPLLWRGLRKIYDITQANTACPTPSANQGTPRGNQPATNPHAPVQRAGEPVEGANQAAQSANQAAQNANQAAQNANQAAQNANQAAQNASRVAQNPNQTGPRGCPPSPVSIELRTAPVTPELQNRNAGPKFRQPVLKTYSALGILKNATQQGSQKIAFVPRDLYHKIHDAPWNKYKDDVGFYVLLPDQDSDVEIATNQQVIKQEHLDKKVREWIERIPEIKYPQEGQEKLFVYDPKNDLNVFDRDFIHGNSELLSLRRYVLIITSDTAPPADAYVAYFDRGVWYYIAGEDDVSKTNFNLIGLFLTVMAVPPTNPQIGTTISVGGG
jgi:hypothetical protein